MSDGRVTSSFRDPCGHVFKHKGIFFRCVSKKGEADYQRLMSSGLYEKLASANMLLPHVEVEDTAISQSGAHIILRPEQLTFVSYPYEWCFSQFKDSALLTLDIQLAAMEHGLTLKDASAYNIQLHRGHLKFIDTTSFTKFAEGEPWIAYGQFCKHFLSPLALMSYRDVSLTSLLLANIDGIGPDVVSTLLPWKSWFNFGIFSNIHILAALERKYSDTTKGKTKAPKVSKKSLTAMLLGLRRTIEGLKLPATSTEWSDYYTDTNYTSVANENKTQGINEMLDEVSPTTLWDLGANDGRFSKLAASRGIDTVALDIDRLATEKGYLSVRNGQSLNLTPLIMNLANPSPSIGWANGERMSLTERGPVDCLLALAIVHHLCFSNNLSFEMIARYFARIGNCLIIEFVPKSDSQAKRLLINREDTFPDYTKEAFETAFLQHFNLSKKIDINGSERILYLFTK